MRSSHLAAILAILLIVFYAGCVGYGTYQSVTLNIDLSDKIKDLQSELESEIKKPNGLAGTMLEADRDKLTKKTGLLISEETKKVTDKGAKVFSGPMSWSFSLVAGVIASIVTGALAISPPSGGAAPGASTASIMNFALDNKPDTKLSQQKAATMVINIYLYAWVVCGLVCYAGCYLWVGDSPVRVPTLYEHGKLWFGLAIGAVIALTGIKVTPPKPPGG